MQQVRGARLRRRGSGGEMELRGGGLRDDCRAAGLDATTRSLMQACVATERGSGADRSSGATPMQPATLLPSPRSHPRASPSVPSERLPNPSSTTRAAQSMLLPAATSLASLYGRCVIWPN
jgi:hypothetical protein